jgi:uncharacterized protein (TIGR02452 family)
MFAARDRALATVLEFCATYRPAHATKRYVYCREADDASSPDSGNTPDTGNAEPPDVIDADALDVALGLSGGSGGGDPLVLVLADDVTPGGCVRAGAGMQEESLFRRTALFAHLTPDLYPLAPDEALYARGVPVLLTSEADGFRPLEARPPRHVAFVACPGIKMPRLTDDGRLRPEDEVTLRRKVRLILRVAREEGHDEVVLGALGCGVWGCPPRHVAQIFAEEVVAGGFGGGNGGGADSGNGGSGGGIRRARFAVMGKAMSSLWRACMRIT